MRYADLLSRVQVLVFGHKSHRHRLGLHYHTRYRRASLLANSAHVLFDIVRHHHATTDSVSLSRIDGSRLTVPDI
jgi:hypothetical protein